MGNGKWVDIKWHWIAYINICIRIVYVWYKARISIFQKTWFFVWLSIFANIIFIIKLYIKNEKSLETQHYPGMRKWNQFLRYFLSWTQCFARFTVWIELPTVPTFFYFSFFVYWFLYFVCEKSKNIGWWLATESMQVIPEVSPPINDMSCSASSIVTPAISIISEAYGERTERILRC